MFRHVPKTAASLFIAFLIAAPFTPVITSWASSGSTQVLVADPTTCKPDNNGDHPNNDNDKKKCPPPVVPEAPVAILLPISAGFLVGGTYLFMRLRSRTLVSA